MIRGLPGRSHNATERENTELKSEVNYWKRMAADATMGRNGKTHKKNISLSSKGKGRATSPVPSHHSGGDGDDGDGSDGSGGDDETNRGTTTTMRRNNPLGYGRGPKIAKPKEFAGERDQVDSFIKDCKIYMMAKQEEFNGERAKIAFILSYCKGGKSDKWANWIFEIIEANEPEAPRTAKEFFNLIQAYFGDPEKQLTARTKLDSLKQNGTVDDYIIEFQELAVEMGYQNHDLCHRFMVGLKEKVRDHCLMTVPPPFTMGEWMERARQIQRQMDLSKALRDGANVSGRFQQKQQSSNYRSYPNNSNNSNWRNNNTGDNLMGTKEPNNRHHQGQGHSEEQENRWKLIEGGHSATFVESSVICKKIVGGSWDYV